MSDYHLTTEKLSDRIRLMPILNFILRDPDPSMWRKFKARANREGHSLRWVILEMIRRYVENGL